MNETVKKELFSWIKAIVLACLLVFLSRAFIFTPVVVKGESMEPTFEEKDKVIVSKLSNVHRFDLIVFHAPERNEQHIKRVIGLPGDRLEMKDDRLYINGHIYEEDYVNQAYSMPFGNITGDFTLEEITGESAVPDGYLFVMGDNRLKSGDSRQYGFVQSDAVIGVVKFRYFPFKGLGIPK